MAATYAGKCHCGDVAFSYTTSIAPSQWTVRSCQCSFCRAHGVRATSDPAGSVRFQVADPDSLVRYEFGLRTAQFLICGRCGVYVAAMTSTPRGRFATLNINSLDPAPEDVPAAQPVTYDGEAPAQRIARREQRWTPVMGDV
jgi:hypothetical protein